MDPILGAAIIGAIADLIKWAVGQFVTQCPADDAPQEHKDAHAKNLAKIQAAHKGLQS